MKNTQDAIRYGIETLNISPNEMFSLIESSKGYDGDDYKRWLASKIIDISEQDGIGFSQLLVKKFSIIQNLSENEDLEIKNEWIEYFKSLLGTGDTYAVGVDGIGVNTSDEIDWFNCIDYDNLNSFFLAESLPDLYSKLMEDKSYSFNLVSKLSTSPCGKGSDLFKDAKELGIQCKTEGSLMLYRVCNMVRAFELGGNFKFCFLVNTDFLCSQDNAVLFKYFEQFFKCSGVYIKSTDLFKETFTSCNYAFVVCEARQPEDTWSYGIRLSETRLESDGVVQLKPKLYTRSYTSLLDRITSREYPPTSNIGYLVVSRVGFDMWVRKNPIDSSDYLNIPICKQNLSDVILYYSLSKSLSYFGLSTTIYEVLGGHTEYTKLLYNCLPLFLFDADSELGEGGILEVSGISSLLERGEVYYSYESKDLLSICKGYLDYLSENSISFAEARKLSECEDLNSAYLNALVNMKDYIKTLYKVME